MHGIRRRSPGGHRPTQPDRLDACPAGQAVLTPGSGLPARYVIHAVWPVWSGGQRGEDELLAGCYVCSLELADGAGLASIAFPCISTGVFGFPKHRVAGIAPDAITSE